MLFPIITNISLCNLFKSPHCVCLCVFATSFPVPGPHQIHTSLARSSTFNNHLSDFSWRVDVKTASKNSPEMNVPIAVVEFGLEAGYKNSNSSSTVRFGMDRDEVATLIDQLEEVQKAVDNATS